jgi:very-short-patch-repair endonuclease
MSDLKMHKDKAARLFKYLAELNRIGMKSILSWRDFEEIIWLHELAEDWPEIPVMAWRDGHDPEKSPTWIEIKKPQFKPPPTIPAVLQGWVEQIHDSFADKPTLVQSSLPEAPQEIVEAYNDYANGKWTTWAEEDRRLKIVQKFYSALFSLYQRQTQVGEEYEILIGTGLLSWKSTAIGEICRHVFVAKTNLDFDPAKGIVSVGPAAEGAKLTVEMDMFPPDAKHHDPDKKFEAHLQGIGNAIWEPDKLSPLIDTWVNGFDIFAGRGVYDACVEPKYTLTDDPTVSQAPALIFRKRRARSMVSFLEKIVERIEEAEHLAPGVLRLVDAADAQEPDGFGNGSGGLSEVCFPKPYNDEQKRIIERIQKKRCVVVQGPPGTGKSHTIANLVCHLLAEGKRILVTSHSPRALKVLKEKIPNSVASLCVTLLDNDRNSLKELEQSVAQISAKHGAWDSNKNLSEIEKAEKALHKTREQEAGLVEQIASIRARETKEYDKFGYEGTLAEISKRLLEEESIYSWVGPYVGEGTVCPLSSVKGKELLHLLRSRVGKEHQLRKKALDPEELPLPQEFAELTRSERSYEEQLAGLKPIEDTQCYKHMLNTDWDPPEHFERSMSELLASLKGLAADNDPWIKQALKDLIAGKDTYWRELRKDTRKALEKIDKGPKRLQSSDAGGLLGRNRKEVKADATDLFRHLSSGKGLGFWLFRPKVVKRTLYITDLTVDGLRCNNVDTISDLINLIDLWETGRELNERWKTICPVNDPMLSVRILKFKEFLDLLNQTLGFARQLCDLKDSLLAAIPGLPDSILQTEVGIENILTMMKSAQIERKLTRIKNEKAGRLTCLLELADWDTHPNLVELKEAAQSGDVEAYQQAYSKSQDLWNFRKEMERCDGLLKELQAVSPKLAGEIKETAANPAWENRVANFEAAWDWARCNSWMLAKNQLGEENLILQLADCRDRILKSMERLVEAKSWRAFFVNIADGQLSHLAAWKKAMDLLGKGTGKHAEKHLKDAQNSMEKCRGAIPAWIMPIFRVVESFSPASELFDVVIVDEASQSGPEAMPVFYLAKRVIVVGDDKQISPTSFLDRDLVDKIKAKHLEDFEFGKNFGPDHSLFDIAQILYPGTVPLREHFRCMPEIIQFSNNICYAASPLIPLRQYARNRLVPVKRTSVTNGYLRGTANKRTNPTEAEALVEQVIQCCEDPNYIGKTMGVISLLSTSDQAGLIEEKLRDRLGPEEMIKRRLVCGDPYAFQGDERDVIFLSMVQAPAAGKTIRSLQHLKYEQRFNVAVSRGRDQVWLFHSVGKDDLSPACLRSMMIEYFENPHVESKLNDEFANQVASVADKRSVPPPGEFDSWFEVDVFLKIAERGYRIIPQFPAGGYSIDLVVEGLDRRLAVECDGDRFHGPEKFLEDINRQSILERCGWTFWRVRASKFYRNPDEALTELWDVLGQHKIYPSTGPEQVVTQTPFTEKPEKGKTFVAEKSAPATTYLPATVPMNNLSDSQTTPSIPHELDISVPVLLAVYEKYGDFSAETCLSDVVASKDYGSISAGSEPEWPAELRDRIVWTLNSLARQQLVRQEEYKDGEIEWTVTDAGLKKLDDLALRG